MHLCVIIYLHNYLACQLLLILSSMLFIYIMKKVNVFLCLWACSIYGMAQPKITYHTTDLKTAKSISIIFSELEELPDAKIIHIQAEPAPLNPVQQLKKQLTHAHLQKQQYVEPKTINYKKAATAPQVLGVFNANFSQGTPNDNDLAVSNGNIIASCVNTNINFYNDTGRLMWGRLLSAISNKLGPLNRTYDPRVIYDPIEDKFILVFLQGSSSTDTRIIIGFTTTNDPSKTWNLYQLPGNFTGDSSWSDYPIIAINKEDLFITVNRLKDNTFWKNGFIESYIWQVNKKDGYTGDSLRQRVYNNIKYNNQPIWSVCPVKNSYSFDRNEMFLLSVRPDQLENDTVFLHYIDNSIASGKAKLSMRILKSPVKYGLQPNAIMPNNKYLQTNDARVLSAIVVNGMIYFTGNCIDPIKLSPSVYFGVIEKTWTSNPTIKAQIISYDSLDIGYPSIAYAGSGADGDHSCMITFSHVSKKYFPGTSVVYVDRYFNISSPMFVKNGDGNINLIADSVQRWGDYTGIQTKYNQPGIIWLNGSYGTTNGDNRSVVARVKVTDPLLSAATIDNIQTTGSIYPNPSGTVATFEFKVALKQLITIDIGSLDGKYLKTILVDWAKPGLNQLRIDTSVLPNGMYFVNLKSNEGILYTHKFIVAH